MGRGADADVLGYMASLSNWGRWGADDRLGTLNLVTPSCRRDAAALVREGVSISCGYDIDPNVTDPIHQFHRYMVMSGEGLADPHRLPHMLGGTADQRWSPSREYIGMVFHGPLVTHVDAPSHMSWDRQIYNGYPAERINSISGAIDLPVSAMADGVTTRGVLIDVAGSRQVTALEPGTAVEPEELERVESHQGSVGPLRRCRVPPDRGRVPRIRQRVVRTVELARSQVRVGGWPASNGCTSARSRSSATTAPMTWPHPATRPLGCRHRFTSCPSSPWASGSSTTWPSKHWPQTCRRLQRWEFMVSISPLRIAGGTGSPVNPIATF